MRENCFPDLLHKTSKRQRSQPLQLLNYLEYGYHLPYPRPDKAQRHRAEGQVRVTNWQGRLASL